MEAGPATDRYGKKKAGCGSSKVVQLLKETRGLIATARQQPNRVDEDYKRHGTASIFVFTDPLSGWLMVHAREQRTRVDWAVEKGHVAVLSAFIKARFH